MDANAPLGSTRLSFRDCKPGEVRPSLTLWGCKTGSSNGYVSAARHGSVDHDRNFIRGQLVKMGSGRRFEYGLIDGRNRLTSYVVVPVLIGPVLAEVFERLAA